MMKRLLIIGWLLLGVNGLQAQEEKGLKPLEKVSFGLQAGWLHTQVTGADAPFLANLDGRMRPLNRFLLGLGVDNPIGSVWLLKHELYFVSYGSRFQQQRAGNERWEATLQMQGLRLNPISLSYRYRSFHIFTGPYTGILLSASIKAVAEDGEQKDKANVFGTENDDQDGTHFLQNMDIGWGLGLEYHFPSGWLLGCQVNQGMATIYDNANAYDLHGSINAPEDLRLYNRSLSLYLGYRF